MEKGEVLSVDVIKYQGKIKAVLNIGENEPINMDLPVWKLFLAMMKSLNASIDALTYSMQSLLSFLSLSSFILNILIT